jgi:hypothetical protein
VAHVVEHLPSKCEALTSNPRTTTKLNKSIGLRLGVQSLASLPLCPFCYMQTPLEPSQKEGMRKLVSLSKCFVCLLTLAVLEMEPRASHMLGKWSTSELHPPTSKSLISVRR